MYDLIIIGGGPGGYTGALSAAKKGKKVLLIEKEELGGVCLNRGCIPTKSLLNSAKQYKKSLKLESFGVDVENVHFNYKRAFLWKDEVVGKLKDNLTSLIASSGIEVVKGEALLSKTREITVSGTIYRGGNILIATGSSTAIPLIPGIENALTSRDILSIEKIPNSLTIIGGGVIGVEFASFFSSIGVQVTIIEMEKRLLPNTEKRIAKILEKSINVTCHFESKVIHLDSNKVTFIKKEKEQVIESEIVLISTGRVPNSKQFDSLGITLGGAVQVNNRMQTEIEGVYAVGDVTGKSLLAHSAVCMAEIAIENMFGEYKEADLTNIPSVVYSSPEIATIGLTAYDAKKQGIPIIKNSFKLNQNGRYLAENGDDEGLCMVLAHKETEVILGVHLIGNGVSEIISTAVLAIQGSYNIKSFMEIVFPHPTLSEVIRDTFFYMK